MDWALRWSNYIGEWDMGLAPFYPLIDQATLDLQATLGEWLWKLEVRYRRSDYDHHWALSSDTKN